MTIRVDDIHINNLKVVGAGNNWNMHGKAINMMEEGQAKPEKMISELLRLEEFEKGLKDARERPDGFVKAVFKFD